MMGWRDRGERLNASMHAHAETTVARDLRGWSLSPPTNYDITGDGTGRPPVMTMHEWMVGWVDDGSASVETE